MRRLNTTEFLARSQAVHGDKYDYSASEYVTARSKLKIICPKHGAFFQVPQHHMKGIGCPGCKADGQRVRRLRTTKEFIESAVALHGGRYDYSKVTYINGSTPVVIGCPVHGDFEQLPRAHLQGSSCPICGDLSGAEARKKSSHDFIAAAREVHGDKYDYSKVEYKGAFKHVQIICHEHGEFAQAPTNHLAGNGCPACKSEKMLLNTETFIERAHAVHGDKYDYSKVKYVHGRKPVTIICPEHGEFKQRAGTHLEGKGCLLCSERGFQHDKPGTLYYLRISSPVRTVYKIGVTNRSVKERFDTDDLDKITAIRTCDYDVGREAYEKEQEILRQNTQYRYTGIDKPLLNGNTELFIKDILGLDKESGQ